MAILKQFSHGGVSGEFWVTKGIYISPDMTQSRIHMNLFRNQAAYASGDVPVFADDFVMAGGDHPFFLKELSPIAEQKLITLAGTFNGGSFVSGI